MSRLKVDMGQGRREEVSVNPNSTLGFVLSEVCKRRKLEPDGYALRHSLAGKSRTLDNSLTIRFAGLSSNATLELIASDKHVVHGECTVAVQREGQPRQMAKFNTATTLASIAAQFAPGEASPCIMYLARTVSGAALAETSLLSLGVSPGSSALLRVSASTQATQEGASGAGVPLAASAAPAAPAGAATPVAPPSTAVSAAPVQPAPAPEPEAQTPAVVVPPTVAPTVAPATSATTFSTPVPPPSEPLQATAGSASTPSSVMDEAGVVVIAGTVEEALRMLAESCADGTAYAEATALLNRYAGNIGANPSVDKFRAIKRSNKKFDATLGQHAAARQLLRWVGFVEEPGATPNDGMYVLPLSADLSRLAMLAHLTAPPAVATPVGTVALPAAVPPTATEATAATASPHPLINAASPAVPLAADPKAPAVQRPQPATNREAPRGPPMTLTETQVHKLRVQKMAARPDLKVPRELQVLLPGEAGRRPTEELPDDFYELTESDLRGFSIGAAGGGAKPAAMQTAAMRELSRLKSQKEYTHAIVRVRLPGGLLVQAAYHPQEPISHVLELVLSCLDERVRAHKGAYLFTTPPRTTLDTACSLVETGMVPAATAMLSWSSPLPEPLAVLSSEAMLTEHARTLLHAAPPDATEALVANFPSVKADGSSAGASDAPGKGWVAVAGNGSSKEPSSSGGPIGAPPAGGNAASGKPRWFNR